MLRDSFQKYRAFIGAGAAVAILLLAYTKPVWTKPNYSNVTIPETTEASYYTTEEKAEIIDQFNESSKDEIQFAKDAAGKVIDYSVDIAGAVGKRVAERKLQNAANSIQSSLSNANDESTTLPLCPIGFELAELIRVSDGDTVFVKILEDNTSSLTSHVGEEVYVRLIGMNTPESSAAERVGYHDSTAYGEMASSYTKNLLKDVTYLWLSRDTSDTDKYDRLLRYVWIDEPLEGDTEDLAAVTKKTLNAILLSSGFADTLTLNDKKYEALFKQLENNAKESSAGLWQYTDNFSD